MWLSSRTPGHRPCVGEEGGDVRGVEQERCIQLLPRLSIVIFSHQFRYRANSVQIRKLRPDSAEESRDVRGVEQERARIFVELMTSDRTLKASREGSK